MYYNDIDFYCDQIGLKRGRIQIPDLFSEQFMREYTSLPSFSAFQYTMRTKIKTFEDLFRLDNAESDAHVSDYTEFSTWREMFKTACDFFIAENIK